MRFRKRPEPRPEVSAVQLVRMVEMPDIATPGAAVVGRAGDWLVIDGQRQFFMNDADFQREYEEVRPALNQAMGLYAQQQAAGLAYK